MSGRVFNGCLSPDINPFDDDYLAEILEATAVAWTRMNHPNRPEIEDRITNRLAARMANRHRSSEFPFDVVPQYLLLDPNGKILGRLDLYIKYRSSHRDYFAFEAKRLHVTRPKGSFKPEYDTYAGKKGMMDFIEGKYSLGIPAAGMLGYVMDGQTDKAWGGLAQCIETRRGDLKLIESCKLERSDLSNAIANGMDGTHLGETEHDLETHHLRIFHLLLPVRYGYVGSTV
jgi:hypothetical protein